MCCCIQRTYTILIHLESACNRQLGTTWKQREMLAKHCCRAYALTTLAERQAAFAGLAAERDALARWQGDACGDGANAQEGMPREASSSRAEVATLTIQSGYRGLQVRCHNHKQAQALADEAENLSTHV
jgi:hypothetical protein